MSRESERLAMVEWRRVKPQHEDIDRCLRQWGSWVRDRPQQGRAQSLEGRYISPQIWHPRSPTIPVDLALVVSIERAVVALPPAYRMHLKLFYVTKAQHQVVRRKLGMTMDGVALHIHACRAMVKNRLARGGGLDVDR